jgi:TfoX/Sxy family transcriptional regulator of competence genes
MAYNEKLADRLREALMHLPRVTEKRMFSGVAFMVNGKMCINVSHDELMCRFDPALFETLVEKPGFRPMVMKGRQLNGYGYVSPEGFQSKKEFDFWVNLCLDFNSRAKASRKKKPKAKSASKKSVRKSKPKRKLKK